jgi:hypothetical protein
MIVRRAVSALLLLLLLAAPLAPAHADPAQTAAEPVPSGRSEPSLEGLLKACGVDYSARGANMFLVTVAGHQRPQHKIFVAAFEGLVLVGTVVASKPDFTKQPEVLLQLLHFNHEFDRVKVAIDDDGDLVVRTDLTLRTLDAPELRNAIDQVGASADEILAALQKDKVPTAP